MNTKKSCRNKEVPLDQCGELIEFLKVQNEAGVFLEPVDYVGLNIPDYPILIKKPMDLSTVEKNLNTKKYKTTESLLEDVYLIWENCLKFNMKYSVRCI